MNDQQSLAQLIAVIIVLAVVMLIFFVTIEFRKKAREESQWYWGNINFKEKE